MHCFGARELLIQNSKLSLIVAYKKARKNNFKQICTINNNATYKNHIKGKRKTAGE